MTNGEIRSIYSMDGSGRIHMCQHAARLAPPPVSFIPRSPHGFKQFVITGYKVPFVALSSSITHICMDSILSCILHFTSCPVESESWTMEAFSIR
ncbi:hypothetical protein QCA50_005442 [Cerrena zonata]|uniref:Uncharacterized protein n=1 Tax=Cerrena zonata TaxID=2478898 RepID=A0AAW0GQ40_9APHY